MKVKVIDKKRRTPEYIEVEETDPEIAVRRAVDEFIASHGRGNYNMVFFAAQDGLEVTTKLKTRSGPPWWVRFFNL